MCMCKGWRELRSPWLPLSLCSPLLHAPAIGIFSPSEPHTEYPGSHVLKLPLRSPFSPFSLPYLSWLPLNLWAQPGLNKQHLLWEAFPDTPRPSLGPVWGPPRHLIIALLQSFVIAVLVNCLTFLAKLQALCTGVFLSLSLFYPQSPAHTRHSVNIHRVDSLEKTLMLGGIGGRKRRGQQRMRWLDGITRLDGHEFEWTPELVMDSEAWRTASHGVAKSQKWLSDWTELNWTELKHSQN